MKDVAIVLLITHNPTVHYPMCQGLLSEAYTPPSIGREGDLLIVLAGHSKGRVAWSEAQQIS